MKLEIGKRYKTRDGRVAEITTQEGPSFFDSRGFEYAETGSACGCCENDLVSEYTEPLNLESGISYLTRDGRTTEPLVQTETSNVFSARVGGWRAYYWNETGLCLDKHHELDLVAVAPITDAKPVTDLADIPNPLRRFTNLESGKRYVDRAGSIVRIVATEGEEFRDSDDYCYDATGKCLEGHDRTLDLVYEYVFTPEPTPPDPHLATVEDYIDPHFPYQVRRYGTCIALTAHEDTAQTLADALNA